MDFGAKISNSWKITKASFEVLTKEPMLIVFPLLSMLATGIIVVSFFAYIFFGVFATQDNPNAFGALYIVGYVFIYFLLYFVTIFSNVVIVGCAKMRLDGKDPTFGDAWKIGFSRIGPILGWTLVAATVGLLLQMLRERMGFIGKIIVDLLGIAWAILTYFVIPVIAVEGIGPIAAIGRSKDILRKSWGEALVTNFGIGLVFAIAGIIVFVPLFFLFVVAIMSGSLVFIFAVLAIAVLVIVLFSAVYTAIRGIVMAALYKFAMTGKVGFGFEEDSLKGMFGQKS